MPTAIHHLPADLIVFQISKAQPLARPESIWLGLGTVLMLLGMAYFIIKGWGVQDTEAREYYVITILIPAIAGASYLSMFFGFGLTEVTLTTGQTLDIYWARYADWLFTTPLLLLDLALLADADTPEIIALLGLDGFMIVTGLVGALTTVYLFRFVWWTVSEIALLIILYYLFTILTAKANRMGGDRHSTFLTLRNLTIVLWFLYPIWWLIGTEGARVVSLFVETLGFMVLDVSAKVGFGFILLRSRAIVGDSTDVASSGATGATDGDETTTQRVAQFELYSDQGGEWRYRLRSVNGRTIASSSEGYDSKRNGREALENVRDYIANADYLHPDPTAFEIYQDQGDEWRWRLIHRNGSILATSGDGYARRNGATRAVERIRDGSDEMSIDLYEDDAGEYRWRLLAGNNRIMAKSGAGYTRRGNAEEAVERFQTYLSNADTIEIGHATFEIYRDEAGKHRWRLRHRNGDILTISRRGFSRQRQVRDAIRAVKRTAPDAETVLET